jgi:HlyD family secretion protein
MDIPRPERLKQKRLRRWAITGGIAVLVLVATAGLARLEPAAPSIPRASVWIEQVREGEMLLEVRGSGTLVPREIRWIASQAEARVDRVVVRPGAAVKPDTVIVEMSNPDLAQQVEAARYALKAAEADLAELRLKLRGDQLDQRARLAAVRADYEGTRLQADAERPLAEQGIVPAIQHRRTRLMVDQLKIRMEAEDDRLTQLTESMSAQLAARSARVEPARNEYRRRSEQLESLQVKAGMHGVLQQLLVQEGQRVPLGTNIARVARPDELRAELQVPETQARDVHLSQKVLIDTRNGKVEGRVVRIDPAVQSGGVQVDVDLTGPLPRGARPDLSVDGTIEIERLPRAVFASRPASSQAHSTIPLFRVIDGGRYAERVPVKLGRTSVSAVEIVQGLKPGDSVILSDMSAWGDRTRVRLND